MISLIRKK